MKLNHDMLFYFLIIAYFAYLLVTIDPNYLDSNQASHGLTSIFVNKLINDYSQNPTSNLESVYDYVNAYYVRYPNFTLMNGPFYPLINGLLFTVFPYSVFLMKLLTSVFSVLTLIFSYYLIKGLFNSKDVALLGAGLTASAPVFINFSRMVMPDMLSVLLFTLGLFFYFRKSFINSLLSGLFFGLSILSNELSLIFVGAVILVSLKYLRKDFKKVVILGVSLIFTLTPYALLLIYSGGIDMLEFPYNLQLSTVHDWLYFFESILFDYSIMGLLLFITGFYFYYKDGDKKIILLLGLVYVVLSILTDKSYQKILYIIPLLSSLMAFSCIKLYSLIKQRFIFLFVLTLFLILPFAYAPRINVPVNDLVGDLITYCSNCTVLITGEIFSSNVMLESIIRDSNASMRFIRPTTFETDFNSVINNEKINRVIIIGSTDLDSASFVRSKYDLIGYYPSDIVGGLYVYDTGLRSVKSAPYCANEICTNYSRPIDALMQ